MGAPGLRVAQPAPGWDGWDAVLDLLRAEYAYMDGVIDPPSSLGRMDGASLRCLAREDVALLAHVDGTLAGCAFCRPADGALYIGKVATASRFRGRGVARALMQEAARAAQIRGLGALWLQVRVELHGVQAAYRAMGFRVVGSTAHPGYDRPTSITMRKELQEGT